MEGGSGGVAAASGVVLRLEAEARGELHQSGKKSTVRGGGGDPIGDGRQHPFNGGSGEVGRRVEGHEEGGGLAPTGGGQLGRRGNDRQWPGRGACGRRTCLHSGGRRRVADERGPTGSWRARGLAGEGNGVGQAQRKREVGQARMNSDDF
jgi:hypothetical protein